MDSLYETYLEFLSNEVIKCFSDLKEILCDEYHMKIKIVKNNLIEFIPTGFSNPCEEIVQLCTNLMVEQNESIIQPILLTPYLKRINIDQLYNLPLSLQKHHKIYSILKSVLFKVFYYKNEWIIWNSDYDSKLIENIWKLVCDEYSFLYDEILDKDCIYFFYVSNTKLIPLYQNVRSSLKLYKIYDNKKFNVISTELPHSYHILSLTQNIVDTKYNLLSTLNKQQSLCEVIIEDHKNNHQYVVCSELYTNLLNFGKLYYHENVYIRYLRMHRQFPLTQQCNFYLHYFHDVHNFRILDKLFEKIIKNFHQDYINVYVNKIQNYEYHHKQLSTVHNKLKILYQMHHIHLQRGIPMSQTDVHRILLYTIDENIMANLLQLFHKDQKNIH